MKRKPTLSLIFAAIAALTFGSSAAWAGHHWGYNNGMGAQGYSQLTQEQQATVQKPESGKIEAVAKEMETLSQQLDQQRVKFDIALAEAGVPRGAGMGYGGCRGNGGGHMGMNHW